MKKLVFGIAFALISYVTFSQSSYSYGKTQLNIGAGFSDYGTPFYIGLDYGAARNVTIGGEFSYRGYREDWENNYYDHNIMGFSGTGKYHFNEIFQIPRRWDLYAGLNVGFYAWTSPDGYNGSHSSGLGLGAQVGGRFFLTPRVGLNLEFGGGNAFSGGKIGLTIKM